MEKVIEYKIPFDTVAEGMTSHALREEFPELNKMPTLWTRSFFCSTAGNVSSDTIEWYVKTQKTRY